MRLPHKMILAGLLTAMIAGCGSQDKMVKAEMPATLQSRDMQAIENRLFSNVEALKDQAEHVNASEYAPETYRKAVEHLRTARSAFQNQEELSEIRQESDAARRGFTKAINLSEDVTVQLAGALNARLDAADVSAKKHNAELWNGGEENLDEAISAMEEGNLDEAREKGEEARRKFKNAELLAIKENMLDNTRALKAKADAMDTREYAPKTYARASGYLETAEKTLEKDRYDFGRARMETQRADYEFRHAMLLAQRIKNLRETDISMEEVILAGENNLHLVADAMREDVHFDSSGIYTAEKLAERAGQLVASKNSLENLLSIEKDQNQALLVYVDNLETRLNINEQTTSAIMSDYFDLASLRARYQTVADRFTSEEATVDLRTGKLVISLHGLVFPVGQATIEDQYKPLLESLAVSIKEFPGTEVVLEGHTDAVGSDELNLKLSKERATVVKDYLVSNFDIDPERIVAAGFGETRPVASNDSQVGRAKNRRIDAVIYLVPKSESISAVQQ